jgi:hypothetical protein
MERSGIRVWPRRHKRNQWVAVGTWILLRSIRAAGFITLGSPLAHAGLLLAEGPEDLKLSLADRELPKCPPALEGKGERRTFAHFSAGTRGQRWVPHHAAAFAPTRWTNVYFPTRATVRGNPIGGPLAPVFGQVIRDAAVQTPVRRGFFSHTRYWTLTGQCEATAAVVELRRALDLAGDQGVAVAEGAAGRDEVLAGRSG